MKMAINYSSIELSDIAYVFSPNIVKIEGRDTTKIQSVTVYMADYEEDFHIEYTLNFNNKSEVTFDISYALRHLFKSIDITYISSTNNHITFKSVALYFYVNTDSGQDAYESIESYPVVFGALKPFKYYFNREVIKIKQFDGLPFSLYFPLRPNAVIQESLNNSKVLYENTSGHSEVIDLYRGNPYITNVGTLGYGKKYQVGLMENGIALNTFDTYPFVEAVDSYFIYDILFQEDTGGIYLMWLNSLGGRSYYLFCNKGESLSVEKEEYNKPNDYKGIVNDVPQWNKKAKRTLKLAIPLAEKEEYDYVEEVLYSPMVYMQERQFGEFIRVNVKTGDYERTSAELQDFVFEIELPEEYTIKI